jgi:hypothetical protein
MARTTNHLAESCFAISGPKPDAARGGVIVRVHRSMRQKSNRPLVSIQALTSEAKCYHGSDVLQRLASATKMTLGK